MRSDLTPGAIFPDIELPDQDGNRIKLSEYMAGQPAIVVFVRGYY